MKLTTTDEEKVLYYIS